MQLSAHSGLSLIELMLGLLVGSIVVAGGIHLYSNNVNFNKRTQQRNTLNQDLRAMMDVMQRDLRRAGFAANHPDSNNDGSLDQVIKNNPFAIIELNAEQNCIVYLLNKNANSPPAETNERLGFKLDVDNSFRPAKSVIRIRRSAQGLDCDSGIWENFTSPDVEITMLQFSLNETPLNVTAFKQNPTLPVLLSCSTGNACLYRRNIAISLSGRLVASPDIQQTLSASVTVRNDRFTAYAP